MEYKIANREDKGSEDYIPDNPADLLNPLQAGLAAFGGNGGRIHVGNASFSNRQSQYIFIDKQ